MGIFYTKTGDDGYTSLIGEGRVAKCDLRLEALGAVDEANSALGLARSATQSAQTAAVLLKTQRDLYRLMAEIASIDEALTLFRKIDDHAVLCLEQEIDHFTAQVSMPNGFIVPGDTVPGAYLDLARTTVRRAERRVTELYHLGQIQNEDLLRYLNRLSSLCFVLEIFENQIGGRSHLVLTKAKEGP